MQIEPESEDSDPIAQNKSGAGSDPWEKQEPDPQLRYTRAAWATAFPRL